MNKLILALVAVVIVGGGIWWLLANRAETPETMTEQNNVDMLANGEGMEVQSEDVAYFEGVTGFYAAPAQEGQYPGVVMIHEWWGLNDQIKQMAQQLAAEGYHVLAVDLFGSVATTPDEARAQVSSLNQEQALANMNAALAYLEEQGATSLGSLGWCFGGGQSLQLSLARGEGAEAPGLDATVIYYGQLVTDQAQLSAIEWPVLGIFGAEDTSIPVETVQQFETALTGAGVENSVTIYPGVGHAFANPSGMNYAPEETQDAWQKTLDFLNQNLKAN